MKTRKVKKRRIIIIITFIVLAAAGITTYGIIRYSKYQNAQSIREKQEKQRIEREEQRKENLKNGVEPSRQIRIPDFTGMTLEEAHNTIESLGITNHLESVEKIDSDLDEGKIVKFTPKQGSSYYEGQLIHFTFYVSKGR